MNNLESNNEAKKKNYVIYDDSYYVVDDRKGNPRQVRGDQMNRFMADNGFSSVDDLDILLTSRQAIGGIESVQQASCNVPDGKISHYFPDAGGHAFIIKVDNTPYLVTAKHVATGEKTHQWKMSESLDLAWTSEIKLASRPQILRPSSLKNPLGSVVMTKSFQPGWAQKGPFGGKVTEVTDTFAYYDASTVPGFSGSPIFIREGHVFALHIQGDGGSGTGNKGILMSAVVQEIMGNGQSRPGSSA